jgi:transglutaminase-like putative cysteine protease
VRARPVGGLVAALATIAVTAGLTTLTENGSWLGRAAWICLTVALVGVVLRWLTSAGFLVLLGQVVATTWLMFTTFAGDRLWWGVPGPDAWQRAAELVNECATVMQRYAAPIPTTDGVEFVLTAAVAALAILVDYLALTRQAPAAAGLPLLAGFLTAAANSGSSLSPWYFALAAGMWLVLLSLQGRWTVRNWSTTVAAPETPAAETDVEADTMNGFGAVGRRLGIAAVLVALILPAVIPHLPTRYILDGLGRNDSGVGRSGRVGFSSTLEVSRSLLSGSQNVVLSYHTSAPSAPPPLRVVVASSYVQGEWRPPARVNQTQAFTQTQAISPQVQVADRQLTVESNGLESPHVASVQPLVGLDLRGSNSWWTDAGTGDLYASDRPDSYDLTYREVDVTGTQLKAGIPGASSGRGDQEVQASTAVDPASAAQVRKITDEVTAGTTTAYDAAVAIQDWLRGKGGFTYSLQLADSATDANGLPITDPILKFLATKQGYCVQFATAMVMMARAKGIPARMAIGFLPGTLENGLYSVRSSDAHTWPELYFPGAGWLRFEPTPPVRTGPAPAYTLPITTPIPDATATAAPDAATATAEPTVRDPRVPENIDPGVTANQSFSDRVLAWFEDPKNLVGLAVLLGLLGTLVLPVTARLVNRRRRGSAATPGELAEAQWEELVSRLGDLGVPRPPSGGTLRDWRQHYVREAYLDGDANNAMGQVVATLEGSRYARPGTVPVVLAEEIRTVTRSAAANRPVPRRVRAFFLPQDGVRWWTRALTRIADAPGRWLDTTIDKLSRRR